MSSWHSYPKVLSLGHKHLQGIFQDPVIVEEKIDGSQFSFGVFDGELKCRSRGQELVVDAPEGMFVRAVESAKERAHLLKDGWTYRGEYLSSPKHNTLKYDRHPVGHIIIFDVNTGEECYLSADEKAVEAERIGLECVPVLYTGLATLETLRGLLDTVSVLGGIKIEGVVAKRHDLIGPDKKCLVAKHVSEAFKEVHGGEWRKNNPTTKDAVHALADRFCAEGRWVKAVQHLTEAGKLTGTPQDIPVVMAEVKRDIRDEDMPLITKSLLELAMPQIDRAATRGLPEWYKARLMESQFAEAAS